MFSILFFFGMPFLAAFLIIYFLLPCKVMSKTCHFFVASLALPLGLGISSCIYFFQASHFYSFSRTPILETMVWVALVGISFIIQRKKSVPVEINKTYCISDQKTSMLLTIGFVLVAISAISIFFVESLHRPHGTWDAISIWNLRARFIFRGDANWMETFTNHSSLFPADYPLLISCSTARLWRYTGSELTFHPILIAFSFMLATVALLVSSLTIVGGRSKGLLAGLLLLGIPYFSSYSAAQCADIPLGFYILATFILLLFSRRTPGNTMGTVFMAGAMAGLSAWTKNEGLLFVAAVIVTLLLVKTPEEKWCASWKKITLFVCGLVPVLAVIAYFKFKFAPESIYFSELNFESFFEMIFEIDRHLLIATYFVKEIFSLTGLTIIILPLCLLFFGVSFEEKTIQEVKIISITLLLVTIGYYLVFLIAPYELEFNLAFGLKRLYLHLLPSAIFGFFLSMPPIKYPQGIR